MTGNAPLDPESAYGRAFVDQWRPRFEWMTRYLIGTCEREGKPVPERALARLIEWDRDRLLDDARD